MRKVKFLIGIFAIGGGFIVARATFRPRNVERSIVQFVDGIMLKHASPPNWRGVMADPTLAERIALALCSRERLFCHPCETSCDCCRRDSAAVVRELAEQSGSAKHWHADQLIALAAELDGGASTTADPLDGAGCHQPDTEQSIRDGWKALERKQDPRVWPAIDPGKEAMALAIARELRGPDV
jgi:hypothetical protein